MMINGPDGVPSNNNDTHHHNPYLYLFSVLEYSFSITYAMMNDMSDGWVAHLYSVLFVEQIEIIGLLLVYRINLPLPKLLKI